MTTPDEEVWTIRHAGLRALFNGVMIGAIVCITLVLAQQGLQFSALTGLLAGLVTFGELSGVAHIRDVGRWVRLPERRE